MMDKHCLIICPQCGSTRIHLVAGGMTGYMYRCRDCDYQGPIRMEANLEMANAIRDEYLKSEAEKDEEEKDGEEKDEEGKDEVD